MHFRKLTAVTFALPIWSMRFNAAHSADAQRPAGCGDAPPLLIGGEIKVGRLNEG